MRSEEIADYAGLIRHCPWTVVCLALALFGLIGLPPLAGFIGKFAVFASVADGFRATGQMYLLILLVVGALNTAISLFYYLNVVRIMTMAPDPETRLPMTFRLLPAMYVTAVTLPTAVLITCWGPLDAIARNAARHLFS